MEATPYSVLISRIQRAPGEASVDVPEDWLQGRTLFGGLQAAVALAAMRTVAPPVPLRSLQGTFIAPVPGGPVRAVAKILRSGKNATHVEARIVDGDATLALFVGVFGTSRPSAVQLTPQQPAVTPQGETLMRHASGVTPNFVQHFKARWIKGRPPFLGGGQPDNVIELGMNDTGPTTEYHVVAMADFIPPIALSFLSTPAPAASLTWMLEILAEDVSALPLDGWRVDAQLMAAAGGYTNQSLMLWGPGGIPVALGRQSMVVFA